jgi:hypothetical protein
MAKSGKTAKRIPSDAPTALIAPEDYEHIYKGNINAKNSQTPRQRSAKVLPPLVLKNVEKLIKKQLKTYEHNSIDCKKCSIIWKLVYQIK